MLVTTSAQDDCHHERAARGICFLPTLKTRLAPRSMIAITPARSMIAIDPAAG